MKERHWLDTVNGMTKTAIGQRMTIPAEYQPELKELIADEDKKGRILNLFYDAMEFWCINGYSILTDLWQVKMLRTGPAVIITTANDGLNPLDYPSIWQYRRDLLDILANGYLVYNGTYREFLITLANRGYIDFYKAAVRPDVFGNYSHRTQEMLSGRFYRLYHWYYNYNHGRDYLNAAMRHNGNVWLIAEEARLTYLITRNKDNA